ncbi:hypothetical protein P43SY_006626 [Pythium insidiosum]|uniref:Uncharacterized protein n=1 Tax=Pythium insidiosum TaxID=114742 RepID=A0AAD5LJM3_PYTIN|nr:hypothetical protein P43SY_006626 [Pythium insidiosum]
MDDNDDDFEPSDSLELMDDDKSDESSERDSRGAPTSGRDREAMDDDDFELIDDDKSDESSERDTTEEQAVPPQTHVFATWDDCMQYMERYFKQTYQDSVDNQISEDTSGFYDYFIRNWHECRKMWCSFERDNVETVGVNTNNRLEATWRHIKTLIRRADHLDVTLSHVEHYQSTVETEYRLNAHPIAHTHDADYDDIISDFSNIVTDYAVQLVLPEYKFAARAVYEYENDGEAFHVESISEAVPPTVSLESQEPFGYQ